MPHSALVAIFCLLHMDSMYILLVNYIQDKKGHIKREKETLELKEPKAPTKACGSTSHFF